MVGKDIFPTVKWQDWVFSAGEVVFLISLFPSLLSDQKPAAVTSIATGITLCTFLFVHASYRLWMTFVLTLATAILWFVLAGQVVLS